jgi:twinkle protein
MELSGEFVPLRTRAILEDTCRKFNVRLDRDSKVVQFPYYSQTGQLVAYKARDVEKDFRWVGKNEDHTLFGQHFGVKARLL